MLEMKKIQILSIVAYYEYLKDMGHDVFKC